jgi:hypothetical protein
MYCNIFRISDYELDIRKKLSYCRESIYCQLFEVTDYEFDIRFTKFKMADICKKFVVLLFSYF